MQPKTIQIQIPAFVVAACTVPGRVCRQLAPIAGLLLTTARQIFFGLNLQEHLQVRNRAMTKDETFRHLRERETLLLAVRQRLQGKKGDARHSALKGLTFYEKQAVGLEWEKFVEFIRLEYISKGFDQSARLWELMDKGEQFRPQRTTYEKNSDGAMVSETVAGSGAVRAVMGNAIELEV